MNLNMKRIPKNPSQDRIKNFLTVTNAIAKQQLESGEKTEFLQAQNAAKVFEKMMKVSLAANDVSHSKHNEAIAFIKNNFPNAKIGRAHV